jgi:hypothetical protein
VLTSSRSLSSGNGVMACLLKNEPASYVSGKVKAVTAGAVAKASLNRAL